MQLKLWSEVVVIAQNKLFWKQQYDKCREWKKKTLHGSQL